MMRIGALDAEILYLRAGEDLNLRKLTTWAPGGKNPKKPRFFHFGGLPRPPLGGLTPLPPAVFRLPLAPRSVPNLVKIGR